MSPRADESSNNSNHGQTTFLSKESLRAEMIDPDRVRHRQLLLSMLLVASLSPTLRKALAAEEGGGRDDTVGQSTTAPFKIIKPPLDDREYFTFMIDNARRVLLCSDPSTNEGAVPMDVHVGATSDPV